MKKVNQPMVFKLLFYLFSITIFFLPSTTLASSNIKYFGYYYGVGSFDGVVEADLDGNCKVDIFDYNILVGNFGK